MNCPRCQNYIVPEFYCINCGHVPPKTTPVSINPTELEAHGVPGTVGQQAPLAGAFSE